MQMSPHQQNQRTLVKMGRQCAARWNTVHGGLRIADCNHPIQLKNETHKQFLSQHDQRQALQEYWKI